MNFKFFNKPHGFELVVKGEDFKYLFKVRRHKVGDTLYFRERQNCEVLYKYEVQSIESRKAILELKDSTIDVVVPKHKLHIAWCVIDDKSIERVLPLLNEIGVDAITFIYCDRSQNSIKIDFNRLERILESSMQQCGRSQMMKLSCVDSLEEFLNSHEDAYIFDFCQTTFEVGENRPNTIVVGCEGGFTDSERELFKNHEVRRLNTPNILKSQTATVSIASMILL